MVVNGTAMQQTHYVNTIEYQMTEIWSSYGPLAEIWFDGGLLAPPNGPNVTPLLQKYQPDAIIFQPPANYAQCIRWVGNEQGYAALPNWSTCTLQTNGMCLDGNGDFPGNFWCPTEVDTPLRGNGRHDWFWAPDGEKFIKTLDQLYMEYIQSTGRNGNYLLNINPNDRGLIDNADMQRYIEFGVVLDAFDMSLAVGNTSGEGDMLQLFFNETVYVDHIILQELQEKGERVENYAVMGELGPDSWVLLVNGTSIGHKKIDIVAMVGVTSLKFINLASSGTPYIRNFAAFFIGPIFGM